MTLQRQPRRDAPLSTVAFEQRLSGTDELWEGVLGGSVNTRAIVLAQPLAMQERIRTELERLAEPHLARPHRLRGSLEHPRDRLEHRARLRWNEARLPWDRSCLLQQPSVSLSQSAEQEFITYKGIRKCSA